MSAEDQPEKGSSHPQEPASLQDYQDMKGAEEQFLRHKELDESPLAELLRSGAFSKHKRRRKKLPANVTQLKPERRKN